MVEKGLSEFFSEYLKKESFFIDRGVFKGSYLPEIITHRDEQINYMAQILAPILRNEKPSNLFVYGKTGTGKTMSIKHIMQTLTSTAEQNNLTIHIIYINCKLKRVADTEYRLVAQLARDFGKDIPSTGLPTDEVYKIFFKAVEQSHKPILLVLDEIDQLIQKTGDGVLYNLTRCNEDLTDTHLTVVGLSNDMVFIDNLDPRVRSSLSEEELVFPPYNALQIQDILRQRSKKAFREDALEPGVIEKCAAYSAREHGDARRALELLRVAGELAERNGSERVCLSHIDAAEDKIEKDRVVDIITHQPKQSQSILYSILILSTNKKRAIFTGEIYDLYKDICKRTGMRPLTQRRISDVLAELDMFGIINAKIISKGRHGRTREVTLSIPSASYPNIQKSLERALELHE
jgi:cell division control protein 6